MVAAERVKLQCEILFNFADFNSMKTTLVGGTLAAQILFHPEAGITVPVQAGVIGGAATFSACSHIISFIYSFNSLRIAAISRAAL